MLLDKELAPRLKEKLKESNNLRCHFPIFEQLIHGKRFAYLDSASTSQKPACVIAALNAFYQKNNAAVHRAVHALGEKATLEYESARKTVQKFINATHAEECIFVKSTTDGLNLLASSFGDAFVQEGDEILVSSMEHHSNIVPWQMLCQRKKAQLISIPMNAQGELEIGLVSQLISKKTKIMAISHISNAIGTVHPVSELIHLAHQKGVPVVVDGAQSVLHHPVNVQEWDCDFFVFSGHKCYGPTGVGVLYGKKKYLEQMPPYQGGGGMIEQVSLENTTYQAIPYKFEAGSPAVAEAVAMAVALEFIIAISWARIINQDTILLEYALEKLAAVPGLHFIGNPKKRSAILSFTMDNIHPHDLGTIVDQAGIALRTGHHCAMPIMQYFQIPATSRISFGVYNEKEDIDQLYAALLEVQRIFNRK